LKFIADFHSKMGVCKHELGGSTPPTPDNSPKLLLDFDFRIFLYD